MLIRSGNVDFVKDSSAPPSNWPACQTMANLPPLNAHLTDDGLAGRLTEELLLAVTNLTKYIVAEDSNNSNNGTSLANKLLPKPGLQYQKKKKILEESESKNPPKFPQEIRVP